MSAAPSISVRQGEIVGSSGKFDPKPIASPTDAARLAVGDDRPDPAEDHFDLLSAALAAAIAWMPRCATVDRVAPSLSVPSHVRSLPHIAHVPGKVARVEGPAWRERDPPVDAAFEHRQGQASGLESSGTRSAHDF